MPAQDVIATVVPLLADSAMQIGLAEILYGLAMILLGGGGTAGTIAGHRKWKERRNGNGRPTGGREQRIFCPFAESDIGTALNDISRKLDRLEKLDRLGEVSVDVLLMKQAVYDTKSMTARLLDRDFRPTGR